MNQNLVFDTGIGAPRDRGLADFRIGRTANKSAAIRTIVIITANTIKRRHHAITCEDAKLGVVITTGGRIDTGAGSCSVSRTITNNGVPNTASIILNSRAAGSAGNSRIFS